MPITNTDRKVGEVSALQSISYRHFSLYGDFMEQIEIGQTLYYEVTDNRDRPTGETKELTVSKIGNKYFYCNDCYGNVDTYYKYDLLTLKYINPDFTHSNRQLYTSLEEIEEKTERLRLLSVIQSFFRDYTKPNKLDLMQLTKIWDIIDETSNNLLSNPAETL